MWRKIVKIFLWLIGTFIVLVLALALTLYLMRDKIKAYAVDYINASLKSDLVVQDIDVTFISTYPKASICLIQPYILDPDSLSAKRDTLFKADRVYFEFDIWDIFEGKYDIHRIRGKKVYTRLFVNAKGEKNFDIVRSGEEKKDKPEELKLSLESIITDDLRFVYKNDFLQQDYRLRLRDPRMTGTFVGDTWDLTVVSRLHIDKVKKERIHLLRNQDGELDLKLHVDQKQNKIDILESDLHIEKMELAVKGTILDRDTTHVDLSVNGKKVPLVSVLSLLPQKVRERAESYQSRGLVNAQLQMKGHTGSRFSPDLDATFSIADGSLTEKTSNISLHNIDLEGTYTNHNKQNKDEIYLKKFNARMKDGSISMAYRLRDFNRPDMDMSITSDLRLETVHQFLQPDHVKSMKGDLHTQWRLALTIDNPDDDENREVHINKASGTLTVKDVNLNLEDLQQDITKLTGTFTINKTDALLEDVTGNIGSTDFHLNGAVQNLTVYLLTGKSTLNIVGAIHSDHIDVNDLIRSDPNTEADQKKSHAPYQFRFPDQFNLNVDISNEHLIWNAFTADQLEANVRMLDKKLDIRNLRAHFAGGTCKGNIQLAETDQSTFKMSSISSYDDVQIDALMKAFDEFGQKMITSENIKGRISADLEMAGELDAGLNFNKEKLVASSKFRIHDGELNDVKSFSSIIQFMRTDKKAKVILKKHVDAFEKRLSHIQFSDMENVIEIRDQQIRIPRMKVSSSALDMNVSGVHAFDNQVDYRFDFRFRDLKTEQTETEFGTIKDDGTGIHVYIRMTGDVNEPNFELDKEQMFESFKEKMQSEKQTVKSLLKDEFGWFRKDSTVKQQEIQKEEVEFLLEWDDPAADSKETKTSEEKKEESRKKMRKLKKKIGVDDKKNEVEFEIDDTP